MLCLGASRTRQSFLVKTMGHPMGYPLEIPFEMPWDLWIHRNPAYGSHWPHPQWEAFRPTVYSFARPNHNHKYTSALGFHDEDDHFMCTKLQVEMDEQISLTIVQPVAFSPIFINLLVSDCSFFLCSSSSFACCLARMRSISSRCWRSFCSLAILSASYIWTYKIFQQWFIKQLLFHSHEF